MGPLELLLTLQLLADALQQQPQHRDEFANHPVLPHLLKQLPAAIAPLAAAEKLLPLLEVLGVLGEACPESFHAGAGGLVPGQLMQRLAHRFAGEEGLQQLLEAVESYSRVLGWFAQLRYMPGPLVGESLLKAVLREGQGEEEGVGGVATGLGSVLKALQQLSAAGVLMFENHQSQVEKVRGGRGPCYSSIDLFEVPYYMSPTWFHISCLPYVPPM
jgi:hypothetical protein